MFGVSRMGALQTLKTATGLKCLKCLKYYGWDISDTWMFEVSELSEVSWMGHSRSLHFRHLGVWSVWSVVGGTHFRHFRHLGIWSVRSIEDGKLRTLQTPGNLKYLKCHWWNTSDIWGFKVSEVSWMEDFRHFRHLRVWSSSVWRVGDGTLQTLQTSGGLKCLKCRRCRE